MKGKGREDDHLSFLEPYFTGPQREIPTKSAVGHVEESVGAGRTRRAASSEGVYPSGPRFTRNRKTARRDSEASALNAEMASFDFIVSIILN